MNPISLKSDAFQINEIPVGNNNTSPSQTPSSESKAPVSLKWHLYPPIHEEMGNLAQVIHQQRPNKRAEHPSVDKRPLKILRASSPAAPSSASTADQAKSKRSFNLSSIRKIEASESTVLHDIITAVEGEPSKSPSTSALSRVSIARRPRFTVSEPTKLETRPEPITKEEALRRLMSTEVNKRAIAFTTIRKQWEKINEDFFQAVQKTPLTRIPKHAVEQCAEKFHRLNLKLDADNLLSGVKPITLIKRIPQLFEMIHPCIVDLEMRNVQINIIDRIAHKCSEILESNAFSQAEKAQANEWLHLMDTAYKMKVNSSYLLYGTDISLPAEEVNAV